MKTTAGTTGSNIVAAVQSNTQRPGLLTIANELRNTIYELVFASDATEPVHLLTAIPPSKALVLASRQTSKRVTVDHCTAADLANIRNLHIKMTSTQLERRVGSLASELVKGSSAVMFARQSDKRWWPSTEMYTTSGYILRWETRGSYRNLGYERYDRAYYEQSKMFSPISLQEISALGGRLFVMK
ncbi:hypothetical protein LTR10_010920 [Elasticomyces elasticus]|nr:hypothetical protein LTR10_010920 [Elasticomyces elasticus]KAK4968525.1 hypothetical protein LTR42_009808 [Elasticomyces elasticus]